MGEKTILTAASDGPFGPQAPDPADRLEGWQEIANYIGKGLKQARRWEKDYGMPVHRIAATGNQVIWASKQEIDAWRKGQAEPVHDASADLTPPPARIPITATEGGPALHTEYRLPVAATYGALFVAGLWTELGYEYSQFKVLIATLTPLVFGVSAGSLWLAFRRLAGDSPRTFGTIASAAAIAAIPTLVLSGVLILILPDVPTVRASFTTRSAGIGYAKNVGFHFVPLLIFLLPPFYVVSRLENLIGQGRAHDALRVIQGTRHAAHVPGSRLFRPKHLTIVFLLTCFLGVAGANYLLDHLVPGPHTNVFTIALYVRMGLWFGLGGGTLLWYHLHMDRLKTLLVQISSGLNDEGPLAPAQDITDISVPDTHSGSRPYDPIS